MRGPTSAAANARLQVLGSPASFAGVDMTNQITIDPGYRTISVKSPEDAGPLNYTLYKVVNGDVAIANAGGQIKLTNTETDNPAAATDPSSVFTNLVLLEGAYVTTSGSFVSTESVKTISLPESPVVEGSVDVFITSPDSGVSGAYTKVDNVFFASGATDNIFQVVYDDDFRATVVFGDGVMGTSPGLDSTYLVTYRVGGGTRGNIPSDYINTTITITDGGSTKTGSLTNVSLAAGGSDAETVEHAKKYAPYFFKRQDRLVTLQDYSTFVNSFAGPLGQIGKGTAVTRNAFSSANTIDLYILQKASNTQLQRATPAFKISLLNAINAKKMITDDVVVVDGLIRTLDLIVTIRVEDFNKVREEEIKLKARDKVLKYFDVDNFDFGKDLNLAELNKTIVEVEDVVYSTVDNVSENVYIDFNEILQLNNLTINVQYL